MEAFDDGDYATAFDQLTKANEASEEPDYEVMNRLAHSYRLSGNTTESDKAFQAIIDAFPGTRKAESAEAYLSWNLNDIGSDEDTSDNGTDDNTGDNSDDNSDDKSDDSTGEEE